MEVDSEKASYKQKLEVLQQQEELIEDEKEQEQKEEDARRARKEEEARLAESLLPESEVCGNNCHFCYAYTHLFVSYSSTLTLSRKLMLV